MYHNGDLLDAQLSLSPPLHFNLYFANAQECFVVMTSYLLQTILLKELMMTFGTHASSSVNVLAYCTVCSATVSV